ncbi:MAG: hypothetical protein ACPLKX_05070 [Dictyoglomaceae bacterium]
MKKIILISIIMGIILFSQSFASFAPMILSARSAGLGEAYIALSDDFSALYYNPAGLTFLKGKNIGFTHLEMPDSWTRVEYIGGIINLDKVSIGLGVSLKGITNSEELLFPFSENFYQVSLASRILPNLSLGGTFYLYQSTLDTGKAFGFGEDLGLIYEVNSSFRVGVVFYNPISRLSWSTGEVEEVERKDLKIGGLLNLSLGNIPLKLLCDFSLLPKPQFLNRVSIGAEVIPFPLLSLRSGYNGEKESISFGLGIKFFQFTLDYAFLYTKGLSNQHILSLSSNF